jgi:hypothetical protein
VDSADAVLAPDDQASCHIEELALFLAAHLGHGPGVLWPEFDHPALAAPSRPGDHDRLAEALGRRTGLAARACGAPADGKTPACLVVHQTAGVGNWHLHRTHGGSTESFRHRLRAGEVLHIPAGWTWRTTPAPAARFIVTRLAPAAPPAA